LKRLRLLEIYGVDEQKAIGKIISSTRVLYRFTFYKNKDFKTHTFFGGGGL